jgi:serine/threonine protein kinase
VPAVWARCIAPTTRATALLAHPNIVTLFDVGTHDGRPFIVTELLEGKTLRDALASGAMDAGRATSLTLQMARGIAAAHALRVVHRDIKPENLFVTADGHLKILDFGLAKLRAIGIDSETADTLAVSTPGMLIGTPGYMAPEQIKAGAVDERTDIFAIGAVLYEMLTGNAPFRRNSAGETLAAILNDRPAAMAAVSPQLQRVAMRCLEKDPGQRVRTAAELAVMLEPLRADTPPLGAGVAGGGARSIAVLPFLDMSPGKDHDYLCDGIGAGQRRAGAVRYWRRQGDPLGATRLSRLRVGNRRRVRGTAPRPRAIHRVARLRTRFPPPAANVPHPARRGNSTLPRGSVRPPGPARW